MITKSKKSLKTKVSSKSITKSSKRKMPKILGKTVLNGAVTLIALYGAYTLYKKYTNANINTNVNGDSSDKKPVIQMEIIPGSFPQETQKQNLI